MSSPAPSIPSSPRSSDPKLKQEMHDSDFYFSDGSIVLSARGDHDDKPDAVVYFRVHRSLLARESAVFANMFNIPTTTPAKKDTYDGVPLVVMHDAAEHLRGFLKAIYEPHSVFLHRFCNDTPNALIGPLLLAKKYEAIALQDRIIAHINIDWPGKDYKDWKVRKEEICRKGYSTPDPERLLYLSHSTKVRDGLATPLAMAYYTLSCEEAHLPRKLLTSEDRFIVVAGRRKMEEFYRDSILNWEKSECISCNIAAFKDGLLLDIMKSKTMDFLESCEERVTNVSTGRVKDLCDDARHWCHQDGIKWLRELTVQVYMKIPEFFSVRLDEA